ncbi:MAG: hypothetical protein ACREQC_15565, partial [Candidatus Binataceae bacterium]
DAQSDPSSQISDLRAALTDVSDDFRAVWKAHEAYRTKLDQDFTDAVRKFQDSTRDDATAVYSAWQAIAAAEDLVKQKQAAFEASYQTLKSTWNDLKTASDTMNQKLAAAEISTSALSDATAAVAAWSIKGKAWTDASAALNSARKDWRDAEANVQKTTDDFRAAQNDYEKLQNDKENPLVGDAIQKNKLRIDFASEYKPFSM